MPAKLLQQHSVQGLVVLLSCREEQKIVHWKTLAKRPACQGGCRGPLCQTQHSGLTAPELRDIFIKVRSEIV